MQHQYHARTRTTYAPAYRPGSRRSGATIYATEVGEGIRRQTTTGDYTAPVVEIHDEKRGLTYFLVESERFAGRYYFVRQLTSGGWHFSGDDGIAATYIGKVEAFIASAQAREVA